MKNALIMPSLLFIAIALSGNLYAQDAKVQSVEFKNFERLPDQPKAENLQLTKKEVKEFDDKGRLVKHETHLANPIGEVIMMSSVEKEFQQNFRTEAVSKYDEMGDLLIETKSYYSSKNKLKVKEEYTDHIKAPNQKYTKMFSYTAGGKPEKITLTNSSSKKVGEELYKYNKDNEETYYKKWEIFPDGRKYQETKKTTYTQEGFLASSEKLVKDGKDTYKDLITFQRNKVKEHLKFKNGEQISSFAGAKAKYDPSKARVLVDFNNGGGGGGFGGFGIWTSEDEFDDKGNKTKTTKYEGEEVMEVITYSYDKSSNLTETKTVAYDDGKETSSSKEVSEYDKHNNMLKKSLYKDEVLITEFTYDYKYY